MRRAVILLAALLVATSLPAESAPRRTIRVIDGDTVKASNLRAPVRVFGYDAPEIHKSVRSGYRCEAELQLGLRAKQLLEELLAPTNEVVVKRTKHFDDYGRRVAVVTSNGVDVGETLVGHGLAKAWTPGERRPDWCN
jgi:micrococcal nuclease